MGGVGFGVRHAGFRGVVDFFRDVFDVGSNTGEFDSGALGLRSAGFGVEAVLDVVLGCGGEIVYATRANVVVRENQAILRRYKGSGSAAGANRRRGRREIQPLLVKSNCI